jgi:uncharacterized protein (TIGR02145 family)
VEWNILSSFLGGDYIAGEKLKETGSLHWGASNVASNLSGFTALPAGQRGYYIDYQGQYYSIFHLMGEGGYFWSSTYYTNSGYEYLFARNLGDIGSEFYSGEWLIQYGFSVRCLKDY